MKLLVFAKQSPLKTDGSMKSTGLDVGTNYDFNFSECVARLQVRVRAQPCVTVGRALYNFSIGGNIHTHTHTFITEHVYTNKSVQCVRFRLSFFKQCSGSTLLQCMPVQCETMLQPNEKSLSGIAVREMVFHAVQMA